MSTKTVTIDLGARSYDIVIGPGVLETVRDHLPFDVQGRRLFLITDDHVEPYAQALQKILSEKRVSFCDLLVLSHGEKTKSYACVKQAHDWMLDNNIQRNAVVFAVGGGVIGDLAGFAAATILRGVPYVQIPTSLLAQVDSSVGGKTGINTDFGKNLVGAFYQPACVIADTDTLKTLPRREVLAGYAEIVKYGLIADAPFFAWLEENGQAVTDLDESALSHAVETSCRAKAAIVATDERESGARALLNLGHSFGHALEAAAGYDGTLLHGEAVAIGMVMAFDLSVEMGLCAAEEAQRVRAHLEKIGLPVDAQGIDTDVDSLIAIMKRDKKVVDDKMTLILVRGIGQAFITQDVDENAVREIWGRFLGA